MKKTLLLLVALMLCLSSTWAQNYDFTSVVPSGQTLYCKINPDYTVSIVRPASSWSGYISPTGNVVIPDSVYYYVWDMWLPVSCIDSYAFYYTEITSISIPRSIVTIKDNAFCGCLHLQLVMLSEGIDTIGNHSFSGCDSLPNIILPNSLKSIGDYAFGGCNILSSISIPDSVSSIGYSCFSDCNNLTSVTIGNSVTQIGYWTFSGCSALSSVTIGNSVTQIGSNAFYGCDSLTRVNYNGSVGEWCSIFFEDQWSNPIYYSHNLYFNNTEATNLVIPDSVVNIHNCAFINCSSLTSITIGNSVTNIGYSAFSGCNNLTSIIIPDNVKIMGSGAFSNCDNLDSITIGKGLIYIIGDGGYTSDDGLHIIPSKVNSFCFGNCPNVKYFKYNCNLRSWNSRQSESDNINNYQYHSYRQINQAVSISGFQTYIIGDSVSQYSFVGCSQNNRLKEVKIGSNINTITYSAFHDCDSLYKVTIGRNVSYISDSAFKRCVRLDTIVALPNNAPSLGTGAFAYTRPNKKVIVPCNSNYDTVWGTTGFVYITGGYTLSLASNNTIWGNAAFVQNVDCSQTAIIEATPSVGYRFVQWSDGNTDNPRTITLSQNTTLTAMFEAFNVAVTVNSSDELMGSVTGGGEYSGNSEVTLTAIPACGHRFVMWNDSINVNPRTFIANSDTSFVAYFEQVFDTLIIRDTTYINIHDTTYVDVHDTTVVTDTVTLIEYVPVHDTTYIDVHDTTYVDVLVHDTTYIDVHDTTIVPVHDTTYVDVFVHDTSYVDIHDTTYIDVFVHDTTTITDTITMTEYVSVHDTTYINVHDTTYINVPVHDTTVVTDTVIVSVHDTTYITQTDTLTVTQYDTIDNYIHDTLTITDTLWLTQYDTILIHDTIFIHDTIVVGVGDVETVNAKIYTNNRQIVVEGADGNDVCLYDINGRILAIKQDYGVPIRFDAPASGTYMIKIGDYPARKVVVIR